MKSRKPKKDEEAKVDLSKKVKELEEDIQSIKKEQPPVIKVLRIQDLPDPKKVNEAAIVRIIGENKYKGYLFCVNSAKDGWDGLNYLKFTEFPYVSE